MCGVFSVLKTIIITLSSSDYVLPGFAAGREIQECAGENPTKVRDVHFLLKEGKRRQQKALPQSGFGFGVVAGCLITWLAGWLHSSKTFW